MDIFLVFYLQKNKENHFNLFEILGSKDLKLRSSSLILKIFDE